MSDRRTRKLVLSALLAALVCATTMVIQIPSPTGGYVNMGDCFVLLAGWLLGPLWGGAAAGIGTMLTDLFMGYAFWAPGSLIIKGLDALAAALLYRSIANRKVGAIVGGIVGELIMICGYFGYAALILGRGTAAFLSVPGNLVQASVGLIVGLLLLTAAHRTHLTDHFQ